MDRRAQDASEDSWAEALLSPDARIAAGHRKGVQPVAGHSGVEAAETWESVAQEEKRMREGYGESQRGSIRHMVTLSAIDDRVKHYKGGSGNAH
jgi:hypothetical protein